MAMPEQPTNEYICVAINLAQAIAMAESMGVSMETINRCLVGYALSNSVRKDKEATKELTLQIRTKGDEIYSDIIEFLNGLGLR
jgi:hypothetical protein